MDQLKEQLPALSGDADYEEFLFHLLGIVEVQDVLASLLRDFEKSYRAQPRKAERVLSQLEVEIYMHIKYHMDCLRQPFEAALSRFYGPGTKIRVDEESQEEQEDSVADPTPP